MPESPIFKQKIYVNDVGTEFRVDCKVDVISAIEKHIRVLKPSGAEASWASTLLGAVGSVTVNFGGTGYAVDDILTVVQVGASGCRVKVTSVNSGVVTGLQVIDSGITYEPATGLSTTGGSGSGCLVNIFSLASATILKYVTMTGDLSEAGIYTLQASIRLPNWVGLGESAYFEVFDRFM
jgi:hypothetical protein